MDETRARLIECFSAVFPELGADEIVQASADSVEGWDSVASVPLFAMVEEEFGIDIDAEDVEAFISSDGSWITWRGAKDRVDGQSDNGHSALLSRESVADGERQPRRWLAGAGC